MGQWKRDDQFFPEMCCRADFKMKMSSTRNQRGNTSTWLAVQDRKKRKKNYSKNTKSFIWKLNSQKLS